MYYSDGRLVESVSLLRRALRIVRGVGTNTEKYLNGCLRINTADDYINEFVIGTNIPEWRFDELGKQYLRYKAEAEKAVNNE